MTLKKNNKKKKKNCSTNSVRNISITSTFRKFAGKIKFREEEKKNGIDFRVENQLGNIKREEEEKKKNILIQTHMSRATDTNAPHARSSSQPRERDGSTQRKRRKMNTRKSADRKRMFT